MLYCVPFNDENVKKFVLTIDALKSLEICYKEDPMEPMLISLKSLEAHTVKYRKYPTTQSLEEK